MKGGEYPYHPVTTGYMFQTMKKQRALFFFSLLKTILISSPPTPPQIGKGQKNLGGFNYQLIHTFCHCLFYLFIFCIYFFKLFIYLF